MTDESIAPLEVSGAADGRAVALARSLLRLAEIGGEERNWRSTVVPDGPDWIVRTWTATSAGRSRPSGRPQFVHRVTPDASAPEGLHADLVWSAAT